MDQFISNRTVAAAFWTISSLIAAVGIPLAHAAEAAYEARTPIPHADLRVIMVRATCLCACAVLMPALVELIPHPNRLDQARKMQAEAMHLYWPMSGRRMVVPKLAKPR